MMKKRIAVYCILICLIIFSSCQNEISKESDNLVKDTYTINTCLFVDIKDKIKTQGRTELIDSGLACDWSAGGIEFNADCEADVSLTLLQSSNEATQYFTIILDGIQQERACVTAAEGELVLAKNLVRGIHNFKVYRQTEIKEYQLTVFKSITLTGKLCDAPANKKILIEFLGDSVTAGIGNMGKDGDSGGSVKSDSTQSYAYLTAQKLDADWSVVAQGGATLAPADNRIDILSIYKYTSFVRSYDSLWNFQRNADIVVVNLGTNDDSVEGVDFIEAVVILSKEIKSHNPSAKIVFAFGMMGAKTRAMEYSRAVEKLGGKEKGFYYVKLPTNTKGSGAHPNVDGNIAATKVLYDFIVSNVL